MLRLTPLLAHRLAPRIATPTIRRSFSLGCRCVASLRTPRPAQRLFSTAAGSEKSPAESEKKTSEAARTTLATSDAAASKAAAHSTPSTGTNAANSTASASAPADSSPSSSSSSSSSRSSADEEADAADAAEAERRRVEALKITPPVTWASLAFLTLVGGCTVAYLLHHRDAQLHTVKVESIGTPLIGGPWKLTDPNGKVISSESLAGKYTLMYFGFTMCPDICPRELGRMGEVMDKLAATAPAVTSEVVPLFISLDPKRDTPQRLAEYAEKWHPAVQFLTGTDEEIREMTKAYRIYYSSSETLPGEDDDYLIDHSMFFYLMDRDGKFGEVFFPTHSVDEIAAKIAGFVQAETRK